MANKTFTQFRVDNVVTTLPTTLAYGQEVYYKDANGNLTLWVGHEDGSAWPSVGYKEYVALLAQTGTSAPVATVLSNTIGSLTTSYIDIGSYRINGIGAFPIGKVAIWTKTTASNQSEVLGDGAGPILITSVNEDYVEISTYGGDLNRANDTLANTLYIRIYP
jgi:hypothetical protein